MPTYLFLHTETDEVIEEFMTYSARQQYLEDNPHLKPIVTAPAIVSGVSSSMRTDDGFKEVLSKISDAHPNSTLADKHKTKTIKEVKTQEVVKKHLGKK